MCFGALLAFGRLVGCTGMGGCDIGLWFKIYDAGGRSRESRNIPLTRIVFYKSNNLIGWVVVFLAAFGADENLVFSAGMKRQRSRPMKLWLRSVLRVLHTAVHTIFLCIPYCILLIKSRPVDVPKVTQFDKRDMT